MITNCDHLAHLKFAKSLPYAFTEHGAIMAAMVLNSPQAVAMPTGGGKTLLACYAAGLAIDELMHAERAVVLWLVPSNTILDQTADALRDPRHPYAFSVSDSLPEVLNELRDALESNGFTAAERKPSSG